jgi:hypothetical protein
MIEAVDILIQVEHVQGEIPQRVYQRLVDAILAYQHQQDKTSARKVISILELVNQYMGSSNPDSISLIEELENTIAQLQQVEDGG